MKPDKTVAALVTKHLILTLPMEKIAEAVEADGQRWFRNQD